MLLDNAGVTLCPGTFDSFLEIRIHLVKILSTLSPSCLPYQNIALSTLRKAQHTRLLSFCRPTVFARANYTIGLSFSLSFNAGSYHIYQHILYSPLSVCSIYL